MAPPFASSSIPPAPARALTEPSLLLLRTFGAFRRWRQLSPKVRMWLLRSVGWTVTRGFPHHRGSPDELLALHGVTAELFATLRR